MGESLVSRGSVAAWKRSNEVNAERSSGGSIPADDSGSATAGSAQHFSAAELYRAHANFVARFLARLGAPMQEVSDLVQEVFLVAHRRGGFLADRAKPTTWLAEIAFRVSSDRRRKAKRNLGHADTSQVTLAVSPGAGPESEVERIQALTRVQKALEMIGSAKRAVFIMFELEGESCASIAEGLQIPLGTVYSRLHTARNDFIRAYESLTKAPESTADEAQAEAEPSPTPVEPPEKKPTPSPVVVDEPADLEPETTPASRSSATPETQSLW